LAGGRTPIDLIVYFAVFIFSLSCHEAAHAWTADKFGDSTGRYLGRITLNPKAHIDILGTIVFPLVAFITGAFMFGWAKPVPVNPLNWRRRSLANIMTSMAGPGANFILAIIAIVIWKIILVKNPVADINPGVLLTVGFKLLGALVGINLTLGVFNLVPIPPLDGSHVLEEFLPYEAALAYDQIRPFGFFLLLGLLYIGLLGLLLKPVFGLVHFILYGQ